MPSVMRSKAKARARSAGDRPALPRLFWRPIRALSRVEWRLPRHAGAKGVALLFALTGAGGVVMGDHAADIVGGATAKLGLVVHSVRITGQADTSELDVLQRLDLSSGASLVTFDVEAARKRIETLPWVASAALRKLYPDALSITIVEKRPFALWRDGNEVTIIDRDGNGIIPLLDNRFAALPLVVGANAHKRAGEIVALLDGFPTLRPRVRAAVLVADRRWNLALESGVEILLPEDNPGAALERVVALDRSNALLARDVSRIDLRLGDRMVVTMTAEAADLRKKLLDQRTRNARKGGAA